MIAILREPSIKKFMPAAMLLGELFGGQLEPVFLSSFHGFFNPECYLQESIKS